MRKLIDLANVLLIALWPAIFLFAMGFIEWSVRNIVSRTFDPRPYIWQVLAYFISGLIFAVIGFCHKDFKRKDILYAHIAAVALVILISSLELLFISGRAASFGNWWRANSLYDFAPFVLGYTIFTSIRAVVLFRRQADTA